MAKKAPNELVPHVVAGEVTAHEKFSETYHASLFVASVTPEEFYLLVGNVAGKNQANMYWRFAASLNCAKRLHAMLGRLLAQHEEAWGPIPLTREPIKPLPQGTVRRRISKGAKK